MTVSSSVAQESFDCDGTTTAFTCPFRVLDSSDMRAFKITIADGSSVELTNGVDFTVSAVGEANAIVTTSSAYSALYRLRVKRDTSIQQVVDYRDNDPFPAESHEQALDRLTHVAQEHADGIGRSLRAPDSEDALDPLPPAASRALRVQAYDSDGQPLMIPGVASDSAAALALDLASTSVSKGSKLVAWIRRVAGAIARTVEDRLSEIESPFNFMTEAQIADVQARTRLIDVSGPMQLFFDACEGGRGRMPPGDYLCNSTLIARQGMQIEGAGIGATSLVTTLDIRQVINDPAGTYSVTFRDLQIMQAHPIVDVAGPSTTATITSGSPAITVASATNLRKGIRISGTGIPANTYIRKIVGTTVTLCDYAGVSVNATASGAGVAVSTVFREGPTQEQFYIHNGGRWLLDNVQFKTLHTDNDYSPTNKSGAHFRRDPPSVPTSSYFVNVVRDCWFDHSQLVMACSDSDVTGCTIWPHPYDYGLILAAPNIRARGGSLSAGVVAAVLLESSADEPFGDLSHDLAGINIDGGGIWYSGYGIYSETPVNLNCKCKFNDIYKAGVFLDTPFAANFTGSTFLNCNNDDANFSDIEIRCTTFQPSGLVYTGCTFSRLSSHTSPGYAVSEVNNGFYPAGCVFVGNAISSNYQTPAYNVVTPAASGQYPKIAGNYGGGMDTESIANAATNEYTGTATGLTAALTNTIKWSRQGNAITLHVPGILGTSNSTSLTLTGMPAAIRPATTQSQVVLIQDNGNNAVGLVSLASTGTMTFFTAAGGGGAFTNVNGKGFNGFVFTYQLVG